MKSTILATAILFSLAAPVSVLAALPPGTEYLPETAVVTTEVIELQVAPEKPAEAVAPATTLVEEQAAAEAPPEMIPEDAAAEAPPAVIAEDAAAEAPPAVIAEDVAAVASSEMVAEDATASGTGGPRKPCLMQGKGMMGKGKGMGMGQGGKGPGCRKQCCKNQGQGQQNKQGQMVRRLDLIDARLDKIEAMLESLMQR